MKSADYFSRRTGYVIDGKVFGFSYDQASGYLRDSCFMTPGEAVSYLKTLKMTCYREEAMGRLQAQIGR